MEAQARRGVPAGRLGAPGAEGALLASEALTGFLDPVELVLTTEAEWREVWRQWTGEPDSPPEPPAAGFGDEMILVAAMGGRPTGGYTIGVDRVDRMDGRIFVVLFTVSPGDGCVVTHAPTAPAIAVALPASDTPVSFTTVEFVRSC